MKIEDPEVSNEQVSEAMKKFSKDPARAFLKQIG